MTALLSPGLIKIFNFVMAKSLFVQQLPQSNIAPGGVIGRSVILAGVPVVAIRGVEQSVTQEAIMKKERQVFVGLVVAQLSVSEVLFSRFQKFCSAASLPMAACFHKFLSAFSQLTGRTYVPIECLARDSQLSAQITHHRLFIAHRSYGQIHLSRCH
ncbi:hypothetical protein BH10CYA1_BH10CYA1_63200 [soil metagenome]